MLVIVEYLNIDSEYPFSSVYDKHNNFSKLCKIVTIVVGLFITTLGKVSDSNSIQANQNYSELFQKLFPNHSELFRTNPKTNFYLV